MANPHPRKCIFCEQPGQRSGEHLIPDWVRRHVPRVADYHEHRSTRISADMLPTDVIKANVRFNQGNLGNRTFSRVCRNCNTGWMKEIQDDIIPTLGPLIDGEWHSIDSQSAARIAIWTAMTCTVIAMSQPSHGVTTYDRRYLFKKKLIPPNWSIWIGRVSGVPEISYCNRVLSFIDPDQHVLIHNEPNMLITTIELGKLLIHCVSSPYPRFMPDPVSYGLNLGILPIHPYEFDQTSWRTLPIMRYGSSDHENVRDLLYAGLMLRQDISCL